MCEEGQGKTQVISPGWATGTHVHIRVFSVGRWVGRGDLTDVVNIAGPCEIWGMTPGPCGLCVAT